MFFFQMRDVPVILVLYIEKIPKLVSWELR